MKKIFSFVKSNIFMIFAIYWLVDFLIGLITLKPSTLDATTRRIKALELGVDLLWTLVFTLEHTVTKVGKLLDERIDCANKRIDIIIDAINEAVKSVSEENKEAEADKKEVN